MNWQSILILAAVIAAAAAAVWHMRTHGGKCSCGKTECGGCCAMCASRREAPKE